MSNGERVACVLRRNADVLLRDGPSGPSIPVATLDDPTSGSAAREVTAERLADDLVEGWQPVRAGEPVDRGDGVVYPFLFDCEGLRGDDRGYTWESPTVLLEGSDADHSWALYERVAPTVETVAGDGTHGAAYLSLRALEVLRDRAADRARRGVTDAWAELVEVALALLEARPAMAVVRNRINRAMSAAANDRTARAVAAAASDVLSEAATADARAARRAADRIRGRSVITISRSGTVLEGLLAGEPAAVIVLESRPAREGVGVAERLVAADVPVTLVVDAAAAHVVATREPDAMLVGADTVLSTGGVVNKVGTRTLATVAHRAGTAVAVAASTDKISPRDEPTFEAGSPAEVYDGDSAVPVYNPRFDRTPAALVDELITEAGTLGTEDVARIARAHERRVGWQSGRSP